MEEWNGKDRRSGMFNKDFYDKMMEIHTDMRYIRRWSEDHDEQDDIRFKEANKKIDVNTKFIYMGIGGLAVVQALLHFFK